MDKQNDKLKKLLKEKGYAICPSCGRELDRGDIAWNNGSTEYGTGYSSIECICQACDVSIFSVVSWYPNIDDLKDVVYVLVNELESKDAG